MTLQGIFLILVYYWYNKIMDIDYNEKDWATPCPKYDCRKTACKCGLKYVNIPASLGDDSEGSKVAPKNGAYCNSLVVYEDNGHVYIYSKEGIPTLIDVDASDISVLEQEVIKAQKDVHDLREDIDDFIYGFDTVAQMKAATNLSNGDRVRTLGYYTKNDGGGAFYKVTNTQPSGHYETLDGLLCAELMTEDTMSVRQFGAKGDGIADDTSSFNIAISNSKKIVIDNGTFLVKRLLPTSNQEIIGVGNPTINLNGTVAPLCVLPSNFRMRGIIINCINESLNWNRCDISNKRNIVLEDCSFIGFRYSETPNAWGILIGNADSVTIRRCYFDNNSQSDIALVNGCTNILIEQCSGSNLHINIEPDGYANKNRDLKISDSHIYKLDILENQLQGVATESLLVSNCTIDILRYDGGYTTIVNSIILDITNQVLETMLAGGVLKFVNTGNFSKNLLEDPFLDRIEFDTSSSQPWRVGYSTIALSSALTTVKDKDGIQTVLNPNNSNSAVSLIHTPVQINASSKYILRFNGKCYYPSTASWVGVILAVRWKDIDNEVISVNRIAMCKGKEGGGATPFSEQTAVLVPPENAVYAEIYIYNASSKSQQIIATNSTYVRSIELFEFNKTPEPNQLVSLPIREHRVFENSVTPNSKYNKYFAGDKLYFKNPTTYIGQIATADGYGSAAGWTNFGALES